MAAISDYVAIDPLALLLPPSVYVRLVEKFHPHVPKVAEILEASREMTAEERSFVLQRARAMGAQAKAIEQAMAPAAKSA